MFVFMSLKNAICSDLLSLTFKTRSLTFTQLDSTHVMPHVEFRHTKVTFPLDSTQNKEINVSE